MTRAVLRLTVLTMLSTALIFLYQSKVSLFVSIEEYAEFSKWLTDLSVLMIFVVLGVDVAAPYFASRGKTIIDGYIIFNLCLFFVICLVTLISNHIFQLNFSVMLIVCAFFTASFTALITFFQFNQSYKLYSYISSLKGLYIIGVFFLMTGIYEVMSLDDVLKGYTFSVFVLCLTAFVFYIVTGGKITFEKVDIAYFKYGFEASINKGFNIALYSLGYYITYYTLDSESVAIYFSAMLVAKVLWIIPDAIGNILYPKFLAMQNQSHIHNLEREIRKLSILVLVFNLIIFVVFFLFGSYIFRLFFNENVYHEANNLFLIFLLGNYGMYFYKILSRYYASRGDWKVLRYAILISITVMIFLSSVLHSFGVYGVSIACSVAFLLCGLVLIVKSSFSIHAFIPMFKLK